MHRNKSTLKDYIEWKMKQKMAADVLWPMDRQSKETAPYERQGVQI